MNKTINEQLTKIAVNKSLLKEYSNSSNDRIVYMNDGTEFQIQIFNPYSYTIGVSFSFNEKNGSYSSWNEQLLVVKPGQRVWLERYLNDEAKLLFSTYEVGNSKAVKEAIKANGKLTIKFYKEKEQIKYQPCVATVWNGNVDNNYYNYCDTVQTFDFAPKSYCSQVDAALSLDSCVGTTKLSCDATNAASSIQYSSASTVTTGSAATPKSVARSMSKSIETGRIDKGSHSSQKFNTINIDFEYYPFSTEVIQILPTSQKPITSQDLQKVYCSNCGRKLNKKYKYCPYCGAQIDYYPLSYKEATKNYQIEKCPYCGRRVRSTMMECPHCGEILR